MSGIDLHTHTTASDGTYAPAELVREAVRRGVRVLAVTDHDSVDAVAPALLAAREHPPLEIVPGIEINTEDPGGEIHVLGYFLDHEALWLRDLLREFREERAARVHRIADRLAALGSPDRRRGGVRAGPGGLGGSAARRAGHGPARLRRHRPRGLRPLPGGGEAGVRRPTGRSRPGRRARSSAGRAAWRSWHTRGFTRTPSG